MDNTISEVTANVQIRSGSQPPGRRRSYEVYTCNEWTVRMQNLKILVALRYDKVTERRLRGSLNQQFSALENMHD